MSNAKFSTPWGDGDRDFRLAIAQLEELQEKCNAGPREIFDRLARGAWRLADIREPIRLGLIGAGVKPIEALSLVRRYVEARPLLENVTIAQAIIAAALVGPVDDPAGKAQAGERAAAGSASPPSTETGPQ